MAATVITGAYYRELLWRKTKSLFDRLFTQLPSFPEMLLEFSPFTHIQWVEKSSHNQNANSYEEFLEAWSLGPQRTWEGKGSYFSVACKERPPLTLAMVPDKEEIWREKLTVEWRSSRKSKPLKMSSPIRYQYFLNSETWLEFIFISVAMLWLSEKQWHQRVYF